jgi:type I restriction enzyme M protein
VLGLIFLLYADYKFALVEQELAAGGSSRRRTLGKENYQAKGALFLPDEARFDYLLNLPEAADIGGAINAAMKAIADENEELGGALPRDYNRLEKPILRELLKILNRIPREGMTEDAFGEIYQYFLGNFAQKEGQKGGEFFTPTSLVKLIVEVIEPDYGMILDPACGAGGMFVQSAVRIRNKLNQDPNKVISVYGQEKVDGTFRDAGTRRGGDAGTEIGRGLKPRLISGVQIKDLDGASDPWTFTPFGASCPASHVEGDSPRPRVSVSPRLLR